MYEGTVTAQNLFSPKVCPDSIVTLIPCQYLDKLKFQTLSAKEQRQIGFPQSPALTYRELIITQGTVDCCQFAMQYEVGMNVAGGTHHAFASHGEEFCLLNDFAVAANYLLREQLVKQILIIDLDVHQGNGTAKLFEQVPAVFTFSMHGKNNYPFHKERSDLDIELDDSTGDEIYLSSLTRILQTLLTRVKPDFCFYLSGVDVLGTDRFGKLNLSLSGCNQRDELVMSLLHQNKIPCTMAMGGGYSSDIKIIVEAHCNTFRSARQIYDL